MNALRLTLALAACGAAVTALAASPAAPAAAASAASAPVPGMGMRHGHGGGHGHAGPDDTWGWSMMSDAERKEHRAKMQGMKTHAQCSDAMEQHHQEMMERAKAQGKDMPMQPRHDACAGLKD